MTDDAPQSASELLRWKRQQERADSSGESMEYERRIANAEALATESWQTIVSTVESGDADAYLDELEREERRRDSPRESVLTAIDDRRED